jgi:hypothetical protein
MRQEDKEAAALERRLPVQFAQFLHLLLTLHLF